MIAHVSETTIHKLVFSSFSFVIGCCLVVSSTATQARAQAVVDRAGQAYAQGNWSEAAKLYEQLVADNPYHGHYWYQKAAAHTRLQQYEEAIQAFEKALELGWHNRTARYGLAICHIQLGQPDVAAQRLSEFFDLDPSFIERLKADPDIQKLHEEYLETALGPTQPSGLDRRAGWVADINYLFHRLERGHYDLFRQHPKEYWTKRIAQLSDRLGDLTDNEIYTELMKIVALAGDGHTNIWPITDERFKFTMLPLQIFPFKDGFHVVAAAPELVDLVGKRVAAIGGVPIQELFEQIEEYAGHENPMHRKVLSGPLLASAAVLKSIGAAESEDYVTLRLEDKGDSTERRIDTIPLDYRQLSLRDVSAPWVVMNERSENPTSLFLKNRPQNYWFEYNESQNLVYFKFNRVRNAEDESFDSFCTRLFESIRANGAETLVIDLRLNDGGNSEIFRSLITKLATSPLNKRGQLFTIIGRGTYSAAMNLVTDLEYYTETIFVGEPTSSAPNFVGENKVFQLPYSGIRVSVSDRYHQRGASDSTDKRIWIAPDLIAEITSDQFRNNVDPAMNAILEYIDQAGD